MSLANVPNLSRPRNLYDYAVQLKNENEQLRQQIQALKEGRAYFADGRTSRLKLTTAKAA